MKGQNRAELLDLRTKQRNKAGRGCDKGRSQAGFRRKKENFQKKDLIAGNVEMGIAIKDSEREQRGESGGGEEVKKN